MAKAQKRSNRETRKPKQDKPAAKPPVLGSGQNKVTAAFSTDRTKGKA